MFSRRQYATAQRYLLNALRLWTMLKGKHCWRNDIQRICNQERVILQTIYVINKEINYQNLRLTIRSGFKSRVGYNGGCTVV